MNPGDLPTLYIFTIETSFVPDALNAFHVTGVRKAVIIFPFHRANMLAGVKGLA